MPLTEFSALHRTLRSRHGSESASPGNIVFDRTGSSHSVCRTTARRQPHARMTGLAFAVICICRLSGSAVHASIRLRIRAISGAVTVSQIIKFVFKGLDFYLAMNYAYPIAFKLLHFQRQAQSKTATVADNSVFLDSNLQLCQFTIMKCRLFDRMRSVINLLFHKKIAA